MEAPMLKLPPILSSSNNSIDTDRLKLGRRNMFCSFFLIIIIIDVLFFCFKLDTNAYEQWRAKIHQELEEDLQRQVRELLDESERQERLAKLEREKLR